MVPRTISGTGAMLMVIAQAILLSSAAIIFFAGNTLLGCAPGLPVLAHIITSITWLLTFVGAYIQTDAAAGLWRVVKGAVFVGLFFSVAQESLDCLAQQLPLPHVAPLPASPTPWLTEPSPTLRPTQPSPTLRPTQPTEPPLTPRPMEPPLKP